MPARALAQSPKHPLDGLTAAEFWTVYDVMKASGHLDPQARFPTVQLHGPPKDDVLQWKPGEPFRREAFVVVRQRAKTFEAIVDLPSRKLTSWKEISGAQPGLTVEEVTSVNEKVKENPEWQAALHRRGIQDFSALECYGLSPGYFGTKEENGRRLQWVECYEGHGTWNRDARPIEGLIAVWDADDQKLVRVIDTGAVPVPRTAADFDPESLAPPRAIPTPISLQQPLGPSFQLDGHQVTWQKWNFHFRMDPRLGLIISNVRYADAGKLRSVLYEGSLSEIFVPYMDPSETWSRWTYFDLGEYPPAFAFPLEPGADCPDNAVFFDTVYANEKGIPVRIPRAACLFERYSGDFAWRHASETGQVESRRSRDLVFRAIGTFGNYDYAFDWVFLQDGSIKVDVGATGIDAMKAVVSKTSAPPTGNDPPGPPADRYGRFIAENTVGIDHDHFFCFRLDLDIDGAANSFVREPLTTERLPAENPRRSVWVAKPEILETEQQARLRMSMEKPDLWLVVNPSVKSPLGYPVGYEIVPGHNAMSLLLLEDFPQRRAGFTDYQLWVTPFRDNERYAGGDYPTQSKGGDGLASWTRANRAIKDTDIVVWYTVGFHHVPRAEDFPVMPTSWHGFELIPYNFFDRNPALDLPK